MSQEEIYGTYLSIFLSLYPKNFGYSLGGYSHRERSRAPDRKESTKKEGEKWKLVIKEKVVGHEV
jgi:hypothetical protein